MISVHSLYAQVPGNVVGPYIVCNGVTGPFDFYWSERANYQGEMVTYTVTDRSGQAFNPADVSKTVSNGVLTLAIGNIADIDIKIKMTVRLTNGARQSFIHILQVGIGDELTSEMLSASTTSPQCRSNNYIYVSVDKVKVGGIDFIWTLPTGWTKVDGGTSNYITVQPDGIHIGDIKCYMVVDGDVFCNLGNNYTGPERSISFNFEPPNLVKDSPSGTNQFINFGSTSPVTFSVEPLSGATYYWSLPCDWKGPNGQTGTYVTTSSSVQFTPSGYSGPGEQLTVNASVDCAGTQMPSNNISWGFQWNSGQGPSISGPDLLCTTDTFYFSSSASPSVTWSITPSYVASPSSGTGGTANVSKNSNGDGTITFNYGCVGNQRSISKDFHSGPYSSSDYPISGPGSASCNQNVYYSIPQLVGVTSINWAWPGGWTYVSGQGTRYLALRTGTYGGVVAVGVNNTCGQSGSYDTHYTSVYGCYGPFGYNIYPNPASSELVIELTDLKTGELVSYNEFNIGQILIINNKHEIVFKKQYKGLDNRRVTVDLRNIKAGTVYVKVKVGEYEFTERVIIRK